MLDTGQHCSVLAAPAAAGAAGGAVRGRCDPQRADRESHRLSEAARGGQLRALSSALAQRMIPRVLSVLRVSPFACTPIGFPDAQRERNQRLRGRLDILLNENEELHAKVSDLKVTLDAARLCRCPPTQRRSRVHSPLGWLLDLGCVPLWTCIYNESELAPFGRQVRCLQCDVDHQQ